MESQTKVIKQIAKDLKSKDQSVIQKALEKTRAKGNESLIDPLVNLYTTSKDEQIKDEIKNIFSELKNDQSINYLLPYLDDNRDEVKELILFSIWSSGIDVSDYLKEITQAACTGNYMVILEALTVIENLEGPFSEEDVFQASTLLQEQLYELPDGSKKELLNSMYQFVQKM